MKIIKNSKGQIITLDLLLALIPITLAIGYSALAIDEMGYRMGLFASEFSLDRRASDAADILIKTPGVPPDWDRTGNLQVIGLARYNLTTNETYDHYLDVLKIAKINKTTMSTIGLTNFRFVLKDLNETVTWSRNSTNPAPPNNASNVVLVHRLVVSARAEQMAGIRNITSQTPVGLTKVNFNFT
ncbi:MAG: hypothetical protein HY929_00150, partial [Euryarchaeota archaeon]|nr:hypothetical protein [Euryarchaeota archaeon]